jgi:hypothetical protein
MREPPANSDDNFMSDLVPQMAFFIQNLLEGDFQENRNLKIDSITYVFGENSAARDDIFALRGLQVMKSNYVRSCCDEPYTEYKIRDLLNAQ